MPSPLTPEARERLACLARAATPGPWTPATVLRLTLSWDVDYAAAASPDVVLALLESEARLRAGLEEIATPEADTLLWPWDARYYRAQTLARAALGRPACSVHELGGCSTSCNWRWANLPEERPA